MPGTVRGLHGRKEGDGRAVPLAAHRFRNREVLTSNGQSGKVTSVLIGDDGKYYAVVDFGPELGSHQVPITSVAYENNRFIVREPDARSLPSFVEGQAGLRSADPAATIDIPGYWSSAETDDSTILVQNAPPQITVQRPALEINWEQAPPEVTVHQPTPMVNVRQAQPVIIVRQPPPKITVELEQPEIIVRMPDPDVDVSIAEPEVQVNVPRPFVQVVQPEQPRVKISAGEPLVSLLPRSQAEVAVERGQPQVHYEHMGEPQLVFRQMDGGPRVRFEEMPRNETLRPAMTTARTTTTTATIQPTTMEISQLEGRKVYSIEGDEVGAVQRVLINRDAKPFIVMERSGLLGVAAQRILLPLTKFAVRSDRLLVRDMAASDIRRLGAWDENMDLYTPASAHSQVRI